MPKAETLILDTHVWLAVTQGRGVAPRVAKRIDAAAEAAELYVAAITPWEVAMGVRRGRIRIGGNTLHWIEEALQRSKTAIASLVPAIAVDAVELPAWDHGDPSDRLIVATARHLGAVLVTADTEILDYAAKVKAVRVLEPR
jgi:PIN domain nuclease of toxin-antitoxin system